ncbi:hypothetical protein IQ07DRAFT_320393 [Pyrenochaeta sp. DS3sAY3a]|nr:hypothetical protein IQ07DRAFT_320393 [Pyrenochaeta sp. DS3sAY3a]
MSRFFSSSARALAKWFGFDRNKLPANWKSAIETFVAPGGSAEQKLGAVQEVEIKSRGNNPVHQSHFNRADKEFVISARITGANGTKTCHVYEDGTGTTKKGGDRS